MRLIWKVVLVTLLISSSNYDYTTTNFAESAVFIQVSNLNSSLSLYNQNLVLSQMHIAEDLLQDLKITCTIQQYFDVVLLQTNFRNHFHAYC